MYLLQTPWGNCTLRGHYFFLKCLDFTSINLMKKYFVVMNLQQINTKATVQMQNRHQETNLTKLYLILILGQEKSSIFPDLITIV